MSKGGFLKSNLSGFCRSLDRSFESLISILSLAKFPTGWHKGRLLVFFLDRSQFGNNTLISLIGSRGVITPNFIDQANIVLQTASSVTLRTIFPILHDFPL